MRGSGRTAGFGSGCVSRLRRVAVAPVQIPLWIDISAVVVAALGGALVAARAEFDLTGVFGLGIITGLGGGLLRDILLNQMPVALKSPWYVVAAVSACAVVGLFSRHAARPVVVLVVLDAMALGLYGVSGANKALVNGVGVWPALLVGMIAANGGGVLRDVLTARPPTIFLRGELYATAALVGLVAYVIGFKAGIDDSLMAIAATAIAFALRVAAWRFGWKVPLAMDAPTRIRDLARRGGDSGS